MEPQDLLPNLCLPRIRSILDGVVQDCLLAFLAVELQKLAHIGKLLLWAVVHVIEEFQVVPFEESIR